MQRISQSMLSSMFLRDMHGSLERLVDVERKMASQQLYSKPSDNPSEVAKGMALKVTLSENEQYLKNLEDAVTWLSTTDTALGQITDVVSSIREKTIYAGNGGLSESDRETIVQDILAMKDELLQTSNVNVGGRYLLAGLDTSSSPFVENDEGYITYEGDEDRICFETEKGLASTVSLNGRDVFPLSFTRSCVTGIEVPMDFVWEGGSELLQISVDGESAQVEIPQRWQDKDDISCSSLTDYDGFRTPGEDTSGYTLQEIADMVNENENSGKLVYASVEKDTLSGTQRLKFQSLSGETIQVVSLPWEGDIETGQRLSSEIVGTSWVASSEGALAIKTGDGVNYAIDVSPGDNLQNLADAFVDVREIWAGVRGDGSITMVSDDPSMEFSAEASGGALDILPSPVSSQKTLEADDLSHIGLSSYLGMCTAVVSEEKQYSEVLGDAVSDNLDIVLCSGDNRMEIVIDDDANLTLDELAQRIRAAAGEWLEVIVQEDAETSNPGDVSALDFEASSRRLTLWAKDGQPLAIFDNEGSWAENLGIQTALVTEDLSAIEFPVETGSTVPAKIGVEIGGVTTQVRIFTEDVTDTSGMIVPEELAREIQNQVGAGKLGYDFTGSGNSIALFSVTGEPLRVVDLAYGDPAFNGLTSGLAMCTGLQSGVVGDWVASDLCSPENGVFEISTAGQSVSVSALATDNLEDIASKIEELAGKWIDTSLAVDGDGNFRLAMSAKDGGAIGVIDTTGSVSAIFGLNTDARALISGWSGGGVLSLSIDGYQHDIDLRTVSTAQGVADLVNKRFCGNDIEAVVSGGNILSFRSTQGKVVTIENLPSGIEVVGSSRSPDNQTTVFRTASNVENTDLFAIIDDLALAVGQGADEALSESFLPRLDQAIDDVLSARSYCGALQKRYETAESRLEENDIALTELYGEITDVDIAEAAMEFETAQTIYQATLATIAKVVQPTLVDYLT